MATQSFVRIWKENHSSHAIYIWFKLGGEELMGRENFCEKRKKESEVDTKINQNSVG